ncbi:MAG TPA: hypothetical protein VFP77_13100 [Gemmatimonadaceae bacterium]|jgi:hypothetical protein|nr:hypothetical protein [Gemmatimonadaceae bacterium]
MDRVSNRIAQAYGYAVCFITVIMMLFSIKSVVDSAIDLSDPLRAEGSRSGRTLTNFEVYKIEARNQGVRPSPLAPGVAPVKGNAASDTAAISDADLRRLYDAEREAAIGNARFRSIKNLIGSVFLIVLAAVLFGIHWRWLRKRDALPVTG